MFFKYVLFIFSGISIGDFGNSQLKFSSNGTCIDNSFNLFINLCTYLP